MSAVVTAINLVASIQPNPAGTVPSTAIDKQPVQEAVWVRWRGIAGDVVADQINHGGLDQAVYTYADEDAGWWGAELGRDVPPGLFGENLRTSGLDVCGAEIGERWRIGSGENAVDVEVTAPRTPCATFAHRMQEQHWVKRFAQANRRGAYLRVLTEGWISAGDPVEITHRPGHGITIRSVEDQPDPRHMQQLLEFAADTGLSLHKDLRHRAELVASRA